MSNELYDQLYAAIGIPDRARALAKGTVSIPLLGYSAPYADYGFPPALLPLCSEASGPLLFGYWRHWFVDRACCIVRASVEEGYRVNEIARNFDQFVRVIALEKIVADDGVEADLEEFARRVSITDLEELDSISIKGGDDPTTLLQHPLFGTDAPLRSCSGTGYKGDFPDPAVEGRNSPIFCGLEIPTDLHERLRRRASVWPWIRAVDQRPIFDGCLNARDFAGAWMSLNSPGWRFEDAKDALQDLASAAGDPNLQLLARAWCSEPHEIAESY